MHLCRRYSGEVRRQQFLGLSSDNQGRIHFPLHLHFQPFLNKENELRKNDHFWYDYTRICISGNISYIVKRFNQNCTTMFQVFHCCSYHLSYKGILGCQKNRFSRIIQLKIHPILNSNLYNLMNTAQFYFIDYKASFYLSFF